MPHDVEPDVSYAAYSSLSDNTLLRIRRYLNDGEYSKAENLLKKRKAGRWKPYLFKISEADLLFSLDKLNSALETFEEAITMLDTERKHSDSENKLFLSAYTDFRRISVEHEIKQEYFENWQDFAKAVMSLPASEKLKRNFYIRY